MRAKAEWHFSRSRDSESLSHAPNSSRSVAQPLILLFSLLSVKKNWYCSIYKVNWPNETWQKVLWKQRVHKHDPYYCGWGALWMWLICAFNLHSSTEVKQCKYWGILFQVTPLPLSCQWLLLRECGWHLSALCTLKLKSDPSRPFKRIYSSHSALWKKPESVLDLGPLSRRLCCLQVVFFNVESQEKASGLALQLFKSWGYCK